jgi:prevent-host-death family protein|tara:strand:+ start:180 stop:467 length:288 start_codon:yes stop_codon:yes gene_type:complete
VPSNGVNKDEVMKQITTAEARKHLAELLNRAAYAKERFVVTRHGKELVAIVPLEEVTLLDRLRALLSKKDFEAAIQEMEDSGTLSWDEVRRDLDL